jgi:SAM-dependent methyltransferase
MSDVLRPTADDALQAWAARVRANREQAERVREGAPSNDFYAPVASAFRADPRRTDDPALEVLRTLVVPGETWLDIGAGGGRYSLPLALLAGRVIAVEPSPRMGDVLAEGIAEHGIANIDVIRESWPLPSGIQVEADVSFISHVGYDIEDLGPFLDAMEASARRLCVAVMLAESPASAAARFWPPIHGEERAPLPALPQFLALLLARGRVFDVRLLERGPMVYHDHGGLLTWLYQQLFVPPESEKGRELALLAASGVEEREGRWAASWTPAPLGIVSWQPPRG